MDDINTADRQVQRLGAAAPTNTPGLLEGLPFLRLLFGEDRPSALVLFVTPGGRAIWCESDDEEALGTAIAQYIDTHNLYFGMGLQDHAAAIAEWHREHPEKKGAPL